MQNISVNENINMFCSQEQLSKFIGKRCIWNLSFMDRPTTGRLIEVTEKYFLIEMVDGRTLVARLDCVIGFAIAKDQAISEAA
jgi:hypothetical protein